MKTKQREFPIERSGSQREPMTRLRVARAMRLSIVGCTAVVLATWASHSAPFQIATAADPVSPVSGAAPMPADPTPPGSTPSPTQPSGDPSAEVNPALAGRVADEDLPKTNAEWRSVFLPSNSRWPGRRAPSVLLRGSIGTPLHPARTAASAAGNRFLSRMKSSKAGVGGLVFPVRSTE